jgi:CheY-like chemotaxis protein/HPt (histidine-containing phosphotransfer) domain-containing protein
MVLVVDDNEVNRVVAVELLGEIGYSSDTACNGVEALAKAQQGGFVAILMDCQMPEMDGYEATRRIRALPPPLCKTPIIAVTAHAMAGDRDRVLQAGMDDYTAKPVRARALARVLQRWVQSAKPDESSMSGQLPAVEPVSKEAARAAAAPSSSSSSDDEPAPRELDPTLPRSARVIELFLNAVPELIDTLDEAIANKDAPRVKTLAHKLKGSCLSLGAEQMAAACYKVERAATEGRIDAETSSRLSSMLGALRPLLVPNKANTTAPGSERRREPV